MTAAAKTTIECQVCKHHVAIEAGKVAQHYPEGNLCDGTGRPVTGFKVTVVDLVTGEKAGAS